jgi:hypothetical protein
MAVPGAWIVRELGARTDLDALEEVSWSGQHVVRMPFSCILRNQNSWHRGGGSTLLFLVLQLAWDSLHGGGGSYVGKTG